MAFDESGIVREADGVKHYQDLPTSVLELLRRTVECHPHREALVELDGPRLSYRQLWDGSARVAGGLRQQGITHGDRVAIHYGNGADWVSAFFGTLMAGGVAVPVNTRLTEPELDHVLADSGARLVLGHGSGLANGTGMSNRSGMAYGSGLTEGAALPDGDPFVTDVLTRSDPAAIFYTSGTTGRPKGALATHENLLTNAENGLRVAGLPRDDESLRNLVSVPLFHVAGCNSQLLPTVQVGGTTVVMPSFEPHVFLQALVRERIRVVSSAPAIYWYALSQPDLAQYDLSGVGWATYGGAPIAPTLVSRIKQAFPNARVGNGFGLTETSSLSTFLPDECAYTHPDSVGFAAPTVDVKLANGASGRAGVGELLVRGANVVSGYWGNPEATARTFRGGWLHTGDLARIDSAGRVYIVDRLTDMINRGGENVYCVEVENVLAAAPGVFEVAVVAVADEMMGEKVGAVVVPVPGEPFDEAAVLDFARERLAGFKVPQYLRVRADPLPRNPGGKVRKGVLRQQYDWAGSRPGQVSSPGIGSRSTP